MAKQGNMTRSNERQVLKKYLTRYYRAKDKRSILQERLRALKRDLGKSPLSVQRIEAKIQQQTEAAEKSVLEIIDVLELLPAESMERTILELRHIDCKTWEKIYRAVYLTRTPCFRYYNRGLDTLLGMNEVRRKLGLEETAGG